jgi:hypothetical protein
MLQRRSLHTKVVTQLAIFEFTDASLVGQLAVYSLPRVLSIWLQKPDRYPNLLTLSLLCKLAIAGAYCSNGHAGLRRMVNCVTHNIQARPGCGHCHFEPLSNC